MSLAQMRKMESLVEKFVPESEEAVNLLWEFTEHIQMTQSHAKLVREHIEEHGRDFVLALIRFMRRHCEMPEIYVGKRLANLVRREQEKTG
jgi:hypothetical protein